jgi:mannose-6-phosphate isomerase-like protein (cupin superfamily)
MMKKIIPEYNSDFQVLHSTKKSQSAVMVLKSDESTGGDDNVHKESDQWLYVIQGEGLAVINGEEIELLPGMLLLIEAGEKHEIKNTGPKNLETLNFYSPPEY